MKLGIVLPTSGVHASPEAIARVAEEAEQIGLASVWTFERLLRPTGPVAVGGASMTLPDSYSTVYEPLETLAYVAARTSRIRLGTSVIDALFHSPVVLGRRLATLDRLSGGRLVAGLAQGWMREEFQVAGTSARRRGQRMEEYVRALRAVWGPDPVTFAGRFYEIPESDIGPKPLRPEGPPVLIGAFAPASLERTGRQGLGLNPMLMGSVADLEGTIGTFRDAGQAAGHDPATLPVVVRVNGTITDDPLLERHPLTGSVDQVLEDLPALEQLGVDEVFWAMDSDAGAQIRAMERLAKAYNR